MAPRLASNPWLLAADTATVDQIQRHYGNLVFMGAFFVVIMIAIIWWVWKNN